MTPTDTALLITALGGLIGSYLTYLLGQRKVAGENRRGDAETALAAQKLRIDADQNTYERHLKEIGRLDSKVETLEKRADQCEEREQQHAVEHAAQLAALQGEISDLRGDLSRIIHRSLVAVITADATGRIVSWSTPAERLFGWRRHEVEGREHITILVPPQSREVHEKAFAEAVVAAEFPEKILREAEALHKDSTRIPVRIHLSRRQNAVGEYLFTAEITLR